MLKKLFHHASLSDLYFLVPAGIAQVFNPITELVIPIGLPSKDAKAEIQYDIKWESVQYNVELYTPF